MIDELQAFLDDHGINHFEAHEIVRARRWNKLLSPDRDLWGNVIPALTIADCAREALGAPVRCASGYRDERYNDSLPGASPTSEHLFFKALDLQPVDPSLMDRFREIMIALVEYARLQGVDARLIHYDTFVHVDVGAAEGKPRGSRLRF